MSVFPCLGLGGFWLARPGAPGLVRLARLTGLHQASFDHVNVCPSLYLALSNLLRNLHMFLGILEYRVEKKEMLKKLF